MCVRVCAYLCIWPYGWCLCVFGVCWCMFVFVYVVLWSMILCVCAFCVMIDAGVCLYAYWPHWVAGAGLGDCVELLSSTSRPHVFSPSSHLPIQTLHHQIQTIYLQTLKHMNMQTYYPTAPISHTHQIETLRVQTSEHSYIQLRDHMSSPRAPSSPLAHTHIKFKHFIIKHSNISVSNTPHVSPSLASSETRQIINVALKAQENFFFQSPSGVSSASMVFLWIFPFFIMQFCSREYLFFCFFSETFLFLLLNLQNLV